MAQIDTVQAQSADMPERPRRGRRPGNSKGFEQKRDAILDAATGLINRNGVKGMTFQDVAQAVALNTTSVTHYFRVKEQLAGAVFARSLDRLADWAHEADKAPTPQARVKEFLGFHFAHRAKVIRGDEPAIAVLSEIRALEDRVRLPLEKQYQSIFRQVRDFFGAPSTPTDKALMSARTHMLLEVLFWLPTWVPQYAIGDFDHVADRLFDVLQYGVAGADAHWDPAFLEIDPALDLTNDSGPANFLRAATRLINERGYRGASVKRIAAELKVTKGSFYHHLDAKDDLVFECFRRSYRFVSCTQRLAYEAGGTHWQRLSSAIATLLDFQFAKDWPMLRTSALQALPVDLRDEVIERSNRLALRFNGMLVNGMREGSIRPIDPMIASQVIMAALNAATDVGRWADTMPRRDTVALYASTLAGGIFDTR